MNEDTLFPHYIHRSEEDRIRQLADQVRVDRASRAVLLYGPGGVGKTCMVRELARQDEAAGSTIWVGPIDIDDSEYWLLSNVERLIADRLDPWGREGTFARYLEYLAKLPRYARPRVGHETVVSHLERIKEIFLTCYRELITTTRTTVVIVFDTVEAIRGLDLLVTLTQLMKALPATLFVLSGRPPADDDADPIRRELADPHGRIDVSTVRLGDFSERHAMDYLNASGIALGVSNEEKAALVRLTRGHPLWLAFLVSYLHDERLPDEAATSAEQIQQQIPYEGEPTKVGRDLLEAFIRRLVAPFSESDFWHEAIKRLAVARESVSLTVWRELMADRPLPEGVASLDDAWPILLDIPWIRQRSNGHYVTLHDAVAEELARRIIPLHDQGRQWRCDLWHNAARIYANRIAEREAELARDLSALAEAEQIWDSTPLIQAMGLPAVGDDLAVIDKIAELDVHKRELCQFRAVRLYYQVLSDFADGCRLFLSLQAQARDDHDVLFLELLAYQMERFLPEGAEYPFGDVIGQRVGEFRQWLTSAEGRPLFVEVGLSMADYLIRIERPQAAFDLLGRLPMAGSNARDRFRMNNLRGNACMRIPGQVKEGLQYFQHALSDVMSLDDPERPRFLAKAHKELGFYYRNEGLWGEADSAYQSARDAISETLLAGGTSDDREEMASIQTNWAYVKGLVGSHREGTNLVESAITIRQHLGMLQEEGISWSVCGEVYRYERRFQKAWKAYTEAEQIFQRLRNWSWLGLIYQEQAICLFQAAQDDIRLTPEGDAVEHAKSLISQALDLCRDLAIRGYPSALNRAGRIFAGDDVDAGLAYLDQGIRWARQLSDGWFWFANLIEYVELSYLAWAENRQRSYLDQISGHAEEIGQVMRQYEFPDLQGRWKLVQGHLAIHQWRETGRAEPLDSALELYKIGFAQIAQQNVGSSGAAAIAGDFARFGTLVRELPPAIWEQWQKEFRRAWSGKTSGSTLLLARLEELI